MNVSGVLMSAFASSRRRTVAVSLPKVAAFRGVTCRVSITSTFAPLASSSFTTSAEGFVNAATISAVRPLRATVFACAPRLSSRRTFAGSATDHRSAVEPNAFCVLTSAPRSISRRIASSDPISAAYMSGVIPRSSVTLALPFWSSRVFNCARLFSRMAE
jgi:hypothetical protein